MPNEKMKNLEQSLRIEEEKPKKKKSKKIEKMKKKNMKLAEEFKNKLIKDYGKIIKSVVLFGSYVIGGVHEKSDIDMLVIIDDTAARFSPEMKETFDSKLNKLAKETCKDISIQPSWTLTEFWDMARIGHPLLYTIVRDGWALYDDGFFIPVKKLLELGKVPGTIEAVQLLMESSTKKIQRAEMAKLYMIAEDLYYAVLNSSQAVLMYLGHDVPAPKFAAKHVEKHLVKTKMLEKKYLDYLKEIVQFRKDVEHKKITEIRGSQLDKFIRKAKRYQKKMESMLNSLEKKKKENMIIKNYELMMRSTISLLKEMKKLPEDPADLPKAIQEDLINKGLIRQSYSDMFMNVIDMRKKLSENKLNKVKERDVELQREYVRRFVGDITQLIQDFETNKKKLKNKKSSKKTKK